MGTQPSPDRGEPSDQPSPPVPDTCPLSHRDQTRNLVLFGVNTALFYVAAPVLLVGILQGAVCNQLGASATVANLPSSAYLVMGSMPVFVAALFPRVSLLKPVMVVCYALLALTGAGVEMVLLAPLSNDVKIAAVVVEGALTGGALTVATMFLFEAIGRGVAPSRRGAALALGYGVGPFLALLSSLGAQVLRDRTDPQAAAVALFAGSAPIMALAAFFSTRLVVPLPAQEIARRPFFPSVFGGLGVFLRRRVFLVITIVSILGFAFYSIGPNLNLYTKAAVGEEPEKLVGYQLALRYGFKGVCGLLFGWLLTRTNPKVGLLAPAFFGLAGVVWALLVPGWWFFLCFGLVGAGELFGVYSTNYILSASSGADTRRNMGFASLMMFPAAPAGALYGAVSDYVKGRASEAAGFRASFAVAIAFMVAAIVLAFVGLPARPRPEEAEQAPSPADGQRTTR